MIWRMRVAAEQARDLGFSGKGINSPKQIAVLNEVFTPSLERIAWARRVIAEFEAADTGLVVVDGKLIEKPVLRDMYRIVTIADRIGLWQKGKNSMECCGPGYASPADAITAPGENPLHHCHLYWHRHPETRLSGDN